MAKEINEKTFELNITNELLNLSKSFIWYLDHFHWFHLPPIINRGVFTNFLNQATFFAEGLTQAEESNSLTGGYDVSINCIYPTGQESRLMFLQYKAGTRMGYSKLKGSQFYRGIGNNTEHVSFIFNDAAKRTQHSTLQTLAKSPNIKPNSVMYVFPRITEKSEFKIKIGNLIHHSSFVPIMDIDRQGKSQNPQIIIKNGKIHKYRTSYDSKLSEVNLLLLLLLYDNTIISELLSELICIQIERFVNILIKQNRPDLEIFLDFLSGGFNRFVEYELKQYPAKDIIFAKINSYANSIREVYISDRQIPQAPSKYTTIVPKEGFKLSFENKNDFSGISYQIF